MVMITGWIISFVIVSILILIFLQKYKKIKPEKKKISKIIFSTLIITLFFGIPLGYMLLSWEIVDSYKDSNECGYGGSTIGEITKTCSCNGLKFDKFQFGPHSSVCFGECKNCECEFYNETSSKIENYDC